MRLLTVDRAAAFGITLYQRHLSPRKGFSCAYRRLHGGISCSEYTKQEILGNGLLGSRPIVRARFQECRDAALRLRIRNMSEDGADLPGGDEVGPAAPEGIARRSLRRRGSSCCSGDWEDACDTAGCIGDLSCDGCDLLSGCDIPSCSVLSLVLSLVAFW